MKLSTKGIYALQFMLYLAERSETGPVTLKEAAAALGVSRKYLEQIAPQLGAAKLLKSTRGASGGYQLARPASAITPYDVLTASVGSLSPVDSDDLGPTAPRLDLNLWKGLDEAIESYLSKDSLQDIVDRESAIAADSYSI